MSTNPKSASHSLPDRPNLRHLKDQAKDLLKAGNAESLTDAQFKLAVAYGFPSWPKLKAHVDALQDAGHAKRETEPTVAEPSLRCKVDVRWDVIHRLAINSNGSRIVVCDDGINLYDVQSNEHLGRIAEPDVQANCLAFSPDDKLLVLGGGGDRFEWMQWIRVYDADTLEKVTEWDACRSNVRMTQFNADGSVLVSCGVDARVKLWKTSDWSLIADLKGHEANIQDVSFSRDGTRIVSGGLDGKPCTWDAKTGKLIAVFEGHQSGQRNYSVALSPDAKLAVSGCRDYNGRIRVWHSESAEQIAEIDAADAANYLAFTPSGKTLVAVLWDGPFLVIDTASWRVVHRIAASDARTHGHALTPDGKILATGSAGGQVNLWDIIES